MYDEHGHKDTCMASVETTHNPTQRPPIIKDMEFALLSMVKKSSNTGTPITKYCLNGFAKSLFSKPRALKIYDDLGMRMRPLRDTLLKASKTNTKCPLWNKVIVGPTTLDA